MPFRRSHGVVIFVSPGSTIHSQNKARIFNTSTTPGNSNLTAYPQLGSPNSECDTASLEHPGIGDGRKLGQAGENCAPVGSKCQIELRVNIVIALDENVCY